MGYLLVLSARCGPRLGNLQSYCANYSKFACTRHSSSLHRADRKRTIGPHNICCSSSPMHDASSSRKWFKQQVDCDLNKNPYELKTPVNRLSSQETEGFNFKYSNHLLGNNVVFRHSSLARKCTEVFQHKCIHTSSMLPREESKVEETLEALKDTIKESATAVSKEPAKDIAGVSETSTVQVAAPVAVKKSIRERVVAELKHYYHGFRLLFIDVKVCARLIWQVLNGRPLTRREQKQLVRTTADMFRLVPFLVIIAIPFAEFALPVLLKFFPGMLPSTFKEEHQELEKRKKRLKMKLEMAKFLQDTLEETSLQRTGGAGESVHDFVQFIEKIRTSGVQASNEDILKYSKLFEDEITLDNLTNEQLRALCRLVEVSTVGTSYFLRFQIEMKLRQLEADDQLIQKEGIDSMAVWELQEACRQRGMRSFGVPEQRLRSQLNQWLDLHLKQKVPTSLLLLSRTLYLPEHLSAEDQLRATLSALPAQAMAEEAKVKILEVSGERVDNKSKLEVIKQEEEIIQREKEELQKEEEAKKAKAAGVAAAAELVAPSVSTIEDLTDKAPVLGAKKIAEIDTEDLGKIEDILDHVISSKNELKKEVEELTALKEDLSEYQENLEDVKEVVQLSGGALPGLTESKAAQRLSRKVSQMIQQMDEVVNELTTRKKSLLADIESKTEKVNSEQVDGADKKIMEQLSAKQDNLITINELLESISKLQHVSDPSKYEAIAQLLDEDKDGVIDYNEAIKVIELLGKENIKLNAEQLTDIMSVLRKEQALIETEKQQKQEERKLQQQSNAASKTST